MSIPFWISSFISEFVCNELYRYPDIWLYHLLKFFYLILLHLYLRLNYSFYLHPDFFIYVQMTEGDSAGTLFKCTNQIVRLKGPNQWGSTISKTFRQNNLPSSVSVSDYTSTSFYLSRHLYSLLFLYLCLSLMRSLPLRAFSNYTLIPIFELLLYPFQSVILCILIFQSSSPIFVSLSTFY